MTSCYDTVHLYLPAQREQNGGNLNTRSLVSIAVSGKKGGHCSLNHSDFKIDTRLTCLLKKKKKKSFCAFQRDPFWGQVLIAWWHTVPLKALDAISPLRISTENIIVLTRHSVTSKETVIYERSFFFFLYRITKKRRWQILVTLKVFWGRERKMTS